MPTTRMPTTRTPFARLPFTRTSTTRMPSTRLSAAGGLSPSLARVTLIGATVMCIAVVVGGWFVGVAPRLEASAQAQRDRLTIETRNDAQRAVLAQLVDDNAQIDSIRTDVDTLRQQIPVGLSLPDLVDAVTAIAASHSVQVTSYKAEEPISPLSLATATATPSPTATTEASATATTPSPTVPSTRLSEGNLYAIPITLSLVGTPSDARATINEIQSATRLFFVGSATINSADQLPNSISELRGFVYVLVGAATATGEGPVR